MVPVNKQSHLRPLATINQVNKCISILKSKPKIKRSMWSRRAQEYEAKISSGKIYELAEVVRDLNKGDDLMVDQSYSERQLFEKAYERILSEFQIVMGVSLEDTQKKLDKALKCAGSFCVTIILSAPHLVIFSTKMALRPLIVSLATTNPLLNQFANKVLFPPGAAHKSSTIDVVCIFN